MFTREYHAEYHEFNAGAHRNTPKNLRAPVLVSHLGFWVAQGPGEESGDGVKRAADAFILAFCRNARTVDTKLELLPNVSNKILLFKTIVDPDRLQEDGMREEDLTRRQNDIFKSGMRSVSIKFRWENLDATLRFEVRTEYVTLTIFIELDKHRQQQPFSNFDDLNTNIDDVLSYLQKVPHAAPKGETSAYLFDGIWEKWDEQFHTSLYNESQSAGGRRIFDRVFADFRGVIFSEDAVLFPDARFFRSGRNPRWGEAAKHKLLPFLIAHDTQRLRKYECAINYLLEGRALLLSTLAPQLPEVPVETRIPVRYVLFAHNKDNKGKIVVNKWQLGRLVNLLHQLGTVRLAGLKDLKDLHVVGQRLSQIDRALQDARESIAGNDVDAMKKIEVAHKEFNFILKQFMESAACGILYRIERSRYYVKQFAEGKKALRIMRLEGDQPYDQFVERRLGAEYDFVDRLGVRYERTTSSIAMLDNNYLSIKAATIDSEATKVNKEIKAIQIWGEFFLLLFLTPYYVSHLVDMLIKKKYVSPSVLIIWSAFGTAAFYRKGGKDGLLGAGILLISLLIAFLIFFSSPYKCTDFFEFCLLFGKE